MKLWKNDSELFMMARHDLFTALVGDVLDKLGFLHQFLPPGLKPIRSDMTVIWRAMPVVEKEAFTGAFEKAHGEKLVLKALQNGMSTVDAFNKYKIM